MLSPDHGHVRGGVRELDHTVTARAEGNGSVGRRTEPCAAPVTVSVSPGGRVDCDAAGKRVGLTQRGSAAKARCKSDAAAAAHTAGLLCKVAVTLQRYRVAVTSDCASVSNVVPPLTGFMMLNVGLPLRGVGPKVKPAVPLVTLLPPETVNVWEPMANEPV